MLNSCFVDSRLFGDHLLEVRTPGHVLVIAVQGTVQQGKLGLILLDPPGHHSALLFQHPLA